MACKVSCPRTQNVTTDRISTLAAWSQAWQVHKNLHVHYTRLLAPGCQQRCSTSSSMYAKTLDTFGGI